MKADELLQARPMLYEDHTGRLYNWQMSDEVMCFLETHVTEFSTTLETGAGVSTVLFALKCAKHTCIVPFEREVNRIKTYCCEHKIATDKITFEMAYSDRCLPNLKTDGLDLILIDGGHAFPIPFLDWFYTADRLKVGGLLLIDDTQLWTGHSLKMFLLQEPEWKLEVDFPPKTVVFKKVGIPAYTKDAFDQPYVLDRTVDLMFEQYPKFVELIRPFVPEKAFHERLRRTRSAGTENRQIVHPAENGSTQRSPTWVRQRLRQMIGWWK